MDVLHQESFEDRLNGILSLIQIIYRCNCQVLSWMSTDMYHIRRLKSLINVVSVKSFEFLTAT